MAHGVTLGSALMAMTRVAPIAAAAHTGVGSNSPPSTNRRPLTRTEG